MLLIFTGLPLSIAGEETMEREAVDCRYSSGAERPEHAAPWRSHPLPNDDVFSPLLADPKQPRFFASYQATRARDVGRSVAIASVGFGENFGLWGRREEGSCNGFQVGILAGVFSQFNLDAPSFDLLNSDFTIGLPFSWRQGPFSTRVRLYHQSSHLGDELLLGNPGINRLNLSFEELEALLSLDSPGGWGRVYAGGGYLLHRDPASLDRAKVQWGVELRGPTWHWARLEQAVKGSLAMTPIFGADFKSFEEQGWTVNTSVMGGLEWWGTQATRRFRVLLNYYRGFNPYGQFFSQKVETFGLGLYLAF